MIMLPCISTDLLEFLINATNVHMICTGIQLHNFHYNYTIYITSVVSDTVCLFLKFIQYVAEFEYFYIQLVRGNTSFFW